ncbi:MAG: hypothetical protein OEN01_02115 [Candidatus Krumholzibacteria bacterium]|nr:hypothetical protein [Candidatus Krumholzibacteria bacterium]
MSTRSRTERAPDTMTFPSWVTMRAKILRRLFSALLVGFAAYRFYQLVAVLVSDPSGVTLAQDVGAPLPLALALRAALPLHLTSVALLMQRPFIRPAWGRRAWFATVISGCWLGVAFLIRFFL